MERKKNWMQRRVESIIIEIQNSLQEINNRLEVV